MYSSNQVLEKASNNRWWLKIYPLLYWRRLNSKRGLPVLEWTSESEYFESQKQFFCRYIRLITRVSMRYGEMFHEPKVSEISHHAIFSVLGCMSGGSPFPCHEGFIHTSFIACGHVCRPYSCGFGNLRLARGLLCCPVTYYG